MTEAIPLRKGVTRKESREIRQVLYSEYHTEASVADVGWGRRRHYELRATSFSVAARKYLSPYMERPHGRVVQDYGIQPSLVKVRARALSTVNGQLQFR